MSLALAATVVAYGVALALVLTGFSWIALFFAVLGTVSLLGEAIVRD